MGYRLDLKNKVNDLILGISNLNNKIISKLNDLDNRKAEDKQDVNLGNVPNTNIAYASTIPADNLTETEVSNLRAGKLDNGNTPWINNNYYSDSDAVSAINNDVDHGSTANHNYFSGDYNDLNNQLSDSDIKTKYENNTDTNAFTNSEKTKLGEQSGTNTGDQDLSDFETTTELNTRDTNNRKRSNHTGNQPASTITGLSQVATSNLYEDLDSKPIIPREVINVLDFKKRVNENSGVYENKKCLVDTIYKLGIIPVFTDHSQSITDYTVTETDVTQHETALSITESQISDFGSYDNYDNWRLFVDGVEKQSIISGDSINIIPGENISITYSSQGLIINSTVTSNNYNNWKVKINGIVTYAINSEEHINVIGGDNIKIESGEQVGDIVISEKNPNKTNGYTVADLPPSSQAQTGDIAHVTDALLDANSEPQYRAIVGSGGGNTVALVMFDGNNWIYH